MPPRQSACGRFQFPLAHHTACPHGLSISLSLLNQIPEQYIKLHHHAFYLYTFHSTARYQTPSCNLESEIWTVSLKEVQINTLSALTNSNGYARYFTEILAAFRIWWAASLRRTEYSAFYRTESYINIYTEATAVQREWNWTLWRIKKRSGIASTAALRDPLKKKLPLPPQYKPFMRPNWTYLLTVRNQKSPHYDKYEWNRYSNVRVSINRRYER
jgi:hypothetical protein